MRGGKIEGGDKQRYFPISPETARLPHHSNAHFDTKAQVQWSSPPEEDA